MFCPRCGKAEQLPETYCRQCGVFLPDLSKPIKREIPPAEQLPETYCRQCGVFLPDLSKPIKREIPPEFLAPEERHVYSS